MLKLIIVESPAKAKTLQSFLGDEYEVIASKGHIRDLPKFTLGIQIDNGSFTPHYEVSKDHSDIVKKIKDKAKKATKIYIATDEDREGEAIGFHIAHIISNTHEGYPRIVFHEITKTAILDALKNPRTINLDMVNAQQARRLLDRIVGFKLSPLLNQKIQKGLSAGRVQSSALKLIVDREREIKAFVPIKYFSIDARFSKNGKSDKIEAQLIQWGQKKIQKLDLRDEKEVKKMMNDMPKNGYIVENIEEKSKKVSPPAPFMTSTLQQSASSALGYSPTRTMQIAQRLYEGVQTDKGVMGLITYMRTDSLNIAKIAQDSARKLIAEEFGINYIPQKPRKYTAKQKGAQEAHEAIRPTRLDFTPRLAERYLKDDEAKLYKLIYNRFLASQSSDAIFATQNIIIQGCEARFKANGSKLEFDGFYKIIGDTDKDKLLPPLKLNENIALLECNATPHETEPPSRFSEASLVKTLESLGIGRPSTYAPTISLLSKRNYITITKKQIHATEISFVVIDMLEKYFLEIVDSHFTANLEEKLDLIAEAKADWQQVLWDFYEPFLEKINNGRANIASLKTAKQTGQMCPKCGKELVIRNGKYGEFTACSGYPKCKYVVPGAQQEKTYLDVPCPNCGGRLVERGSRRGKFYGCSNYPKCTFISNYKLSDEKCACGSHMVIKELKKGTFVECPKCRAKKQV